MFLQIANSLSNPPAVQKTYIMHLLAAVTEQENLLSFLRDHISPRPLHHMVARQPESPSQLATLQARRGSCKSTCSASILGRWVGTRAGTKIMEAARTSPPRPPGILQRLQCLSGCTVYLSTGLLALRLCPQFPTFPSACCATVIPPSFPIWSPFSYLPSILDPSPGWAHFLPGSTECLKGQSTQSSV